VSPFVYSCLFPVSVQDYRPLPPGENPTAVNKYHHHHHHHRRRRRRRRRRHRQYVCSLKFNLLVPAVFVWQLLRQNYDACSLQTGALKIDRY
jgi:hypothetical protein